MKNICLAHYLREKQYLSLEVQGREELEVQGREMASIPSKNKLHLSNVQEATCELYCGNFAWCSWVVLDRKCQQSEKDCVNRWKRNNNILQVKIKSIGHTCQGMKLRQLYAKSEPSLLDFYWNVTSYYSMDWYSCRFLKLKKKIYLNHISFLKFSLYAVCLKAFRS